MWSFQRLLEPSTTLNDLHATFYEPSTLHSSPQPSETRHKSATGSPTTADDNSSLRMFIFHPKNPTPSTTVLHNPQWSEFDNSLKLSTILNLTQPSTPPPLPTTQTSTSLHKPHTPSQLPTAFNPTQSLTALPNPPSSTNSSTVFHHKATNHVRCPPVHIFCFMLV